jgi:geranylgeranyl reductase family protein
MAAADVLVVGAGPAGSASAIRLARAGLRVILVDRARFPREKVCSEYMSPEAVRRLHHLGLLEALERAGGVPVRGTTVIGPRGSKLTGVFDRAPVTPFRPAGLSIPRLTLDHHLLEGARSAGATVLEGRLVRGLLYDRGAVAGAVVRDENGRTDIIRARVTIGADGLRSTVARRLGTVQRGWPSRLAFVTHVRGDTGLADQAELHVGRQGYVGLNPVGDGLTNVALVVPRRRARAARGNISGFVAEALAGFPAVWERLAGTTPVRDYMVTGPFAVRARRVTAPGALLVGDAADFFDPFTGEGICTALRGAELAAGAVLAALTPGGTVRRRRLLPYEAARRTNFRGKWMVERLIGWGMFAPRLFDRAVARLEARGWSHTFIGVTGDFVPARAVLRPRVLAGMIW